MQMYITNLNISNNSNIIFLYCYKLYTKTMLKSNNNT